uniref:Uncharacterized protein n=1 Tax=Magallana gigas TaxID=29159 RepID=A0A8W8MM85_MAGGI
MLDSTEKNHSSYSLTEAYNMGVAALSHVMLLVLGCALRALLKHFNVQCWTPVRRRLRTKQEMCVLEEGSLIFQKPTSGGGGLKIEEVEMSKTRAPEEKDDSPPPQRKHALPDVVQNIQRKP